VLGLQLLCWGDLQSGSGSGSRSSSGL
jgi:hypothetical protein